LPSLSEIEKKCPSQKDNRTVCNCTYQGCPRHGLCCQCLQYHLRQNELPACCFPPEVEKTYDRSFKRFIETYS